MTDPDPAASALAPTVESTDQTESVARASFLEIFGALTLATPTLTILRHPFRFSRYTANPGSAIHYLYAAVGVLLVVSKWTGMAGDNDGGDVAPELTLVNRLLGVIGPHARLEGSDAIAVMLLFGNIVGGLTAYAVCRWLVRRSRQTPAVGTEGAASQTLAATAYLGGASSVLFALGLIAARGNTDTPPMTIAVLVIFGLVYCWGRWIRSIHGLVLGRTMNFLFPFLLGFACLFVFATLTSIAKIALGGTVTF